MEAPFLHLLTACMRNSCCCLPAASAAPQEHDAERAGPGAGATAAATAAAVTAAAVRAPEADRSRASSRGSRDGGGSGRSSANGSARGGGRDPFGLPSGMEHYYEDMQRGLALLLDLVDVRPGVPVFTVACGCG